MMKHEKHVVRNFSFESRPTIYILDCVVDSDQERTILRFQATRKQKHCQMFQRYATVR